jgi:hypothetical protein
MATNQLAAQEVKQYLPYPNTSDAYEKRWNPDLHRYQGGVVMLREFDIGLSQFVCQAELVEMLKAKASV